MKKLAAIRSGGQTGADRGALDAAKSLGVPIAGWCPKGGWAEDLLRPPGLLADYPELAETPSADVSQRTAWNVRDAHATLAVVPSRDWHSPGTALTIDIAKQYGRPLFIATEKDFCKVVDWLDGLGFELTLNVAGLRESTAPGIYETAFRLVRELLLGD
ncbi:MAG: putative molybdenum carrier protein [Coriobacteriia bacterium]|nr:putative molybdenum carrier protein [Coriobacteriia bacterium]